MTKELLISSSPHETKVAVLEDDQLVEVFFQRDTDAGLVGGIYKGKVNRVLPGMQSAFVDIGLERDAFLYVSDFFEDSEEYDRVFTEAENRVARLSGEVEGHQLTLAVKAPPVDSRTETPPAPPGAGGSTAASAEAQTQAPEGGFGALPVAGGSSPASGEYRRHEFSGRRAGRRGRRFREGRFSSRRESGQRPVEDREQTPAHGLEPLPGESLAKYSHAAPEGETTAPATDSTIAPGVEFSSQALSAEASLPPKGISEIPGNAGRESWDRQVPLQAGSVPVADLTTRAGQSRELENSGALAETPTAENAALEAAAGPSVSEPDVIEKSFFSGTMERLESVAGETQEANEFAAAIPDDEAPASLLDSAAGLNEPEGGVAAAEGAGAEPGLGGAEGKIPPGPTGQSYTLRDSYNRTRVAPRRGRRARGRFRGNSDRRPEAGAGSKQESARAGNQQPLAIHELLREGQEILVQIAKEPLGSKGARITSHIALPGRYLVYMPTIDHIGVSRKIGSEEERLRLRNIILENKGPLAGGFIVRTAGAGRSEEEFKADLTFLANLWNDVRSRAERSKAPALLHRDLTLVERILRDLLSPDFKGIRLDNEIEYEHVLEFVSRFQPSLIGHVRLYTRETPLFEEFGVQAEIDKALKPKVWLKSGGYIVINQTEALVAIDVNTGKYVGRTNRLEDTIVKTNIDAVKEIVRQIRLRDLGGIIVIDFIDMDERRNRTKVVQALDEALRHDRAPTKILSFNEFGLVALTRKRVKQSLERTLCERCPYCTGAGWVKSVTTVSNEIVSEARKMAAAIEGGVLNLRVHPQVASALKSRGGVLISEIESATGKEVVVKADDGVHQEQFEIF